MTLHSGYSKIVTDESLRERICHGSEEYPFQYYLEDIWQFDFHCIDWHWHPEVEFVFMEKGTAEFLIGGGRYSISAGTGVFINSQVLHRFEAAQSAVIPNIVFSPSLLAAEGSLLYRKYIQPVLDSPIEYLIFSGEDAGQKEFLNALLSVFALQEAEAVSEIQTVEQLLKVWRTMYENTDIPQRLCAPRSTVRAQAQLQIMLQYIHKNYSYPITLEDIANTVTLSKSSVLNIFNKNIHTSPVNYLVNYRLKCAAKLLVTTQNSVSSIARDTGFENIGYFCRKFKEVFRVTPGKYRKSGMEPDAPARRETNAVLDMDMVFIV